MMMGVVFSVSTDKQTGTGQVGRQTKMQVFVPTVHRQHTHRTSQAGRQIPADRQTGTQADRQTGRQANIQTGGTTVYHVKTKLCTRNLNCRPSTSTGSRLYRKWRDKEVLHPVFWHFRRLGRFVRRIACICVFLCVFVCHKGVVLRNQL